MRPLRVALIHRNSPRVMETRMVGWWSYAVPEFVVTHYVVGRGFRLDRDELAKAHDMAVYEDAKIFGTFSGKAEIPIFYHAVDSTALEGHYQHRLSEGSKCDVILVDHDKLERFEISGRPVFRFGYCINDHLFYDYELEKTVDVSFHCNAKDCPERVNVMLFLADFCKERNYVFVAGQRDWIEYAKAFNRSKITVNVSVAPPNRPHRVFDAMGSKTCLITNHLCEVSGEERKAGIHYLEYSTPKNLANIIDEILSTGLWKQIGEQAYRLVHEKHTWQVRAGQLRELCAGLAERWPALG